MPRGPCSSTLCCVPARLSVVKCCPCTHNKPEDFHFSHQPIFLLAPSPSFTFLPDGDVDMAVTSGPTNPNTNAAPPRDPALAALDAGVARALRTNRPLILCRAGCGVGWEPTSNLDPGVRRCPLF